MPLDASVEISAMRFKIKSIDAENLEAVRRLVKGAVPIYVDSEKRLTLSTGELSPELRSQIEDSGATVTEEQQYDLDGQP